jgi:hypothetical protein
VSKKVQVKSKNGNITTQSTQYDYNSKAKEKEHAMYKPKLKKSTTIIDTTGYSKGKASFPIKKYSKSVSPRAFDWLGTSPNIVTKKLTKSKISRDKLDESLSSRSSPRSAVSGKVQMKDYKFKKGGKVTTKPKKK